MIPLSCLLFKYAQDEQQQQPQQQKSWFLRHPYATAAGAGALGVGAMFVPSAAKGLYNAAKPLARSAFKSVTNPENIKYYAGKALPIMAESAGKEVGDALYRNRVEGEKVNPLDVIKKSLKRGGRSVATSAGLGLAGKAIGAVGGAIGSGLSSMHNKYFYSPPGGRSSVDMGYFTGDEKQSPFSKWISESLQKIQPYAQRAGEYASRAADIGQKVISHPATAGGLLGAGVSYDPHSPWKSSLRGGAIGAAGGAIGFGSHIDQLGIGGNTAGGAFLKGMRDTMAYNTLKSMHSKNQQTQKNREYENFYNSLTPEQMAIIKQYQQNGRQNEFY